MPRIRFTDGVSQLDGAPLTAPFDLRNAELERVGSVRALPAPEGVSPSPPLPAYRNRVFRHRGLWLEGRDAVQVGEQFYVAKESGIDVYRGSIDTPSNRIPQVESVEAVPGNIGAAYLNADVPRYIHYILVPVNEDGEAGPWAYAGAYVDGVLPQLNVATNEYVERIVVYKTCAVRDGAEGTPDLAGVTPRRLGVFGAGVSGLGSGAGTALYTYAESGDADVGNPLWIGHEDINYIPLSSRPVRVQIPAGGIYDNPWYDPWDLYVGKQTIQPVDFADPVGWQVEFESLTSGGFGGQRITSGSVNDLTVGTRYEVESFIDSRLRIRTLGGDPVSFDMRDIVHTNDKNDSISSHTIRFFPPSPSGTDDRTFVIIDNESWATDVDPNQTDETRPNFPDTPTVYEDRPFNTHSPASVGQSGDALTQSGVNVVAASSIHYEGGRLYAGAPDWPTKPPAVTHLETDPGGVDVRLHCEYQTESGAVLGRPREINNCQRVACQWQGAESALRVFVRGGFKYEIVEVEQEPDLIYIDDPDNDFQILQFGQTNVFERLTLRLVVSSAVDEYSFDSIGRDDAEGETIIGVPFLTEAASTKALASAVVRDSVEIIAAVDGGSGGTHTVTIRGDIDRYERFIAADPLFGQILLTQPPYAPNPTGVLSANDATSAFGEPAVTLTIEDPLLDFPPNSRSPVSAEIRRQFEVNSYDWTPDSVTFEDPDEDLSYADGDTITAYNNESGESREYRVTGPSSHDSITGRTTVPVDALFGGLDGIETSTGDFALSTESTWRLYRRVVPSPEGAYLRDGSMLVFNITDYEVEDAAAEGEDIQWTDRIYEPSKVFYSAVNRPMEMTYEQFRVPEGSEVRALLPARLAEEEGLRAYRFYVGTDQSLYVAQPGEGGVTTDAVTTSFGISVDIAQVPIATSVPGGILMAGTNGRLYYVRGRSGVSPTSGIVPIGSEPWDFVLDLAYNPEAERLWIAANNGVWGYEFDRGLIAQQDYLSELLVWDEDERAVLGLSLDANKDGIRTATWSRVVGESAAAGGASGTAEVTLQPVDHDGREVDLSEVRLDVEQGGVVPYEVDDPDSWPTMTVTRRHGPESLSQPVPRGYPLSVPMRGEGVQLSVGSFVILRGIHIASLRSAD